MLNEHYEIEGWFKLTVTKASTGEITKETGWFKNVITNFGMNYIAGTSVNCLSGAAVGTGTIPETVNDTALQTFLARTNAASPGSSNSNPQIGSNVSPYYAKVVVGFRFAEGTAAGNLTEVGIIAQYSGPSWPLWSRTLIKDQSGSPIAITILPDEILDVTYECRVYPQEVPTTSVINILGVDYSCKNVGQQLASTSNAYPLVRGFGTAPDAACQAFSGPLGATPNNLPTGTSLGSRTTSTAIAYVQNSFTSIGVHTFSPGTATGGIRSLTSRPSSLAPSYSLELTPAFPKTATLEFKVTHKVTWSRRVV